ncbi:hypothetical protein Q3C01_40060 [Bradyrhizobium sp. UFLA05-109]
MPYRLGYHRQGESIMPGFEIAWNRRRLASRYLKEPAPWVQDAILLERVLLDGQAQLKIVCRIASVVEDRLNDPTERDHFWRVARARLGKVHRLTGRDRADIERLLATNVPRPVMLGRDQNEQKRAGDHRDPNEREPDEEVRQVH